MSESLSTRVKDSFEGLLTKKLLKTLIIVIISLTAFVLVWWGLSIWANTEYLPDPGEVYTAFINSYSQLDPGLNTTMWQNIWASLQRFVWGFLLAFVVAVPLGLLMGSSRLVETFSRPIVEVFRPIPPIAWVPILILLFGYIMGPIITIFIGVFFPILSSVIFGVRSVDPVLIDAAKTQGAKRWHVFSKVIMPFTVPFIMTGIRIGMGIGWMCIVAAEIIGGQGGGVGFYISYQSDIGRYAYAYAGMATLAILGLLTTSLSGYIENRVNKRMGMK
ncbi:MAG: ABC transporter permease [Methanomassiliicoccales archaeon]